MSEDVSPGTLYVISTPIGNLDDISIRALRILSGVSLIAAEDTRKTKVLLDHFDIHKPLVSYFSYNEARRTPELIARLKKGESIGVVSDAGTPGISDPAFRVIRSALDERLPVIAIPGPTAFLPALIASGLPSEEFLYEGFLPVKKGRKTKLEALKSEPRTIVLYESPHRLLKTLRELRDFLGDRPAAVSRELTKKFEETIRGKLSELIEHFTNHPIRGEFVVVVGGVKEEQSGQ